MKLEKTKQLAVRTLGLGKDRIIFNQARLDEIKEALTKQDIRDLLAAGAITIKGIKGRKTVVKRKNRRRAGSIKRKSNPGKRGYIIITRKLREYLSELRKQEMVSQEQYLKLRKEIKARAFKSKSNLKERLAQFSKK